MSTSPPTEYFPGINFNVAFYNTGSGYVTKDYVDNNFLKSVGYSTSYAISTTFNNIVYFNNGFVVIGNINVNGDISANNFKGAGAQLTSLNASNISTGTLPVARGGTGAGTFGTKHLLIGNGTDPVYTTANLVYDTSTNTLIPINISANGAGLTYLNASNVATGTLTIARGGTNVASLIADRLLIGGTTQITQSGNLSFDSSTNILTASNIAGNGSRLTNLNVSNATDGTLSVPRGGTGAASFTIGRLLIGNGTTNITEDADLTWDSSNNILTATNIAGDGSRLTNLNVSNVLDGTLGVAHGGTGQTTFGQYRILYGSGGNGAISTLADLTFNGSTLTCYGEFQTYKGISFINNQNSRLNRTLIANEFATGTAIGDIVLISDSKLHLIGGSIGATTVPGITINATNNVGIGNTAPAAGDKLSITGNLKLTGTATIDTNLVVGGAAGIIGTTTMTNATTLNLDIIKTSTTAGDFINMRYDTTNGLRINQAYVAANDIKQIFIQKNNNVDSNTLTIYKSNIGIGTTAPTNILQVGAGGRLRISNGPTDYTLLGTIDTDGSTNTSIIISGNTRLTNPGNIQYLAIGSGNHTFYTGATTTQMIISTVGVSINNDLGVTNGNVGFGTAPTTTYKLNVNGSTFINNQLKFSNRYTDLDNFPCNKINLLISGGYGFGIFTSTLEYFSAFDHRFYSGSSTSSFGNERLRIEGSTGIVYINDLNTDNGYAKLIVAGSDANGVSAYFYHPNRTQGLGIVYNGLRATGSGANVNIELRPKGSGTVSIFAGMVCNNYITAPSYILSNDAVYARSSYDTKIRSDSGGMYLDMGDIGNNNYLTIGAYNGVTEISSKSSRSIYFRCTGLLWIFSAGGTSSQANNSIYWGIGSDQRIKENIKKANLKTCYNNVKNINLYRFNFINGYKKATQHDKTQLGFIAQQVQQHFPKSVSREKIRIEDKREIPDLSILNADQINYTFYGAVKQLIRVVEKQSKRIKKLEELLNIIDDDEVEDDADEPYIKINCEDEYDIDEIEPSEPEEV